jgi:hypothetical protein
VVLTHDERLPEAARRLGLNARVLEVARAERSEVTIRLRRHPVEDYVADARAVLATEEYPDEARRRVIPGLCRNAVEAACAETTRRRLLGQGAPLREVNEAIDGAGRLYPRLALALFGDAGRGGEVLGEVNRRFGGGAGDTVVALNSGAHQLVDDDPRGLVDGAHRLALGILELP